jgi:hypothetical protein
VTGLPEGVVFRLILDIERESPAIAGDRIAAAKTESVATSSRDPERPPNTTTSGARLAEAPKYRPW